MQNVIMTFEQFCQWCKRADGTWLPTLSDYAEFRRESIAGTLTDLDRYQHTKRHNSQGEDED